ncbi:Peptidoglycan/xylan/chitin deacetylase, PgdA/CDA1 family [Micromonospora pattaloongensis]|uniref:Peptidoglycan/xylan/chitin deacetylase, PgdA/CDA1 family n=1 Tax=Micromonospora pattaloongensis TaxID=405436 RepID=A0A1H3GYW7_9ACTN|nr:polysaccharide deacetylase family protein [Micromonospora pattaloongensis]SDY08135.1 Peptidoglycan/xylan/chitin deacetylase, PgdA/CDA1 family [Micromonospora pattaloongensis]
MTIARRTRMLMVAALAAVTIMAAGYTWGSARLPDSHHPRPAAWAYPSGGPADVPRAPDSRPAAAPAPPALGAGTDGPYGSRQTTGGQSVALTFDDGPDPRYTPQILALLRRYQVKATFCLIGANAQAYPTLVRQIATEGHTLCNHSWDHDLSLGSRSTADIQADLTRASATIRAAAPGHPVSYYRQPGGNWTPSVVAEARNLGMTSLDWAVDPRDWERPDGAAIAAMVNTNTAPGSIVLMHDGGGTRTETIAALQEILPHLTQRFRLDALPPGSAPANPPN